MFRAPQRSAHQRGYGATWRRVRLRVLWRDQYRCYICGRPANTVDHVVPLAEGGARYDPATLRACCFRCNVRRGAQLGNQRAQARQAQRSAPRRMVHWAAVQPDDLR